MTKKILIVSFLSCLALSVAGQDKIFLSGGNKLKGVYIASMSTDTTLYLRFSGTGVHIPYNAIRYARFSRESRKLGLNRNVNQNLYTAIKEGYYHRIGAEVLIGSHDVYYDQLTISPSLQTVTGYKWSNLLNGGVKVGMDIYERFVAIPIAAHYEMEVTRRNRAPIIMGGLGYGIVWDRKANVQPFDKVRGGIHYYMSWGYRFRLVKGELIVKMGGLAQRVVQEVSDPNDPDFRYSVVNQKRLIRRLSLGATYTF